MSSVPVEARRECFPIESLRYMENKIGEIRREIMDRASQLAANDPMAGDAQMFTIAKCHIDEAVANSAIPLHDLLNQ